LSSRIPIIIGIPLHDIMHGMPIAIMAFMALQRSVIMPIPEPSMGIILTTMPSLVISQVIRHIIGIAIIGMPPMGIIPGIIPFIIGMLPIGIMPGIIPGIIPFIIGMPPIGIMPGIIPGIIPLIGIGIGIIIGIGIGMPAFCIGMPLGMDIGIALIGVIMGLLRLLGSAEGWRTRLRYAWVREAATNHTGARALSSASPDFQPR